MSKTNLDIVSVIPARSGSKGVPGKNLRLLGGVPLFVWSIMCSRQSTKINQTIVSTDSQEYAEVARKWGADVPFLRPGSISQDNSTDLDFVLHLLSFLEKTRAIPDLLIHLRPTTPFRDPSIVDTAIESVIENYGKNTALRSVNEMSESAYKSFEISKDNKLVATFTKNESIDSSNMNRQNFPLTYSANGYVDILFPEHILETGTLHGNNVKSFITDSVSEVDSETDFELLQMQLKVSPNLKNQIFGAHNGGF
jgi:N-acylneuraminate cytidylyltransferase